MSALLYPITVMICYLFTEAVKGSGVRSSWLPIISLTVGGMLCGVGYALGLRVEADLVSAIFRGILCGLAATGGDQAYRHAAELVKKDK